MPQPFQIISVQGKGHPLPDLVCPGLFPEHIGVRFPELLFVKAIPEAFTAFFNFLVNFIFQFCQIIFQQHVCPVSFFGIPVVYERIVKSRHVPAGFPYPRVHENGCIQANDVVMHPHHRIPPVFPYVVLEFHAVLTVVVHGTQSVVYLAGGKNKTILLGMGNNVLE